MFLLFPAPSNPSVLHFAQVYVGSAVEPLVEYLCGELAESFKAEGATLPPWRSVEAMLSKWRPRHSVDHDLLKPHGLGPHSEAGSFGSSLAGLAALGRPTKSQRLSASGAHSMHLPNPP